MTNRLVKLQALKYVPAIFPVAARGAYCFIELVEQSLSGENLASGLIGEKSRPVPPVLTVQELSGDKDSIVYGGSFAPDPTLTWNVLEPESLSSGYAPTTLKVKTCLPAVAAVAGRAARYDVLDSFGWNSGGRSKAEIPDFGYFRATLPASPVGVQVGICRRGFGCAYGEMQHSLVARIDEISVVESGATVAGPFPLLPSSTVEIRRSGGAVTYFVAGVQVYASSLPSSGEAYIGTSLYAASDYVDSPVIGQVAGTISFSATMPLLVGATGQVDYSFVRGSIAPIKVTAQLDAVQGDMQLNGAIPGLVAAISGPLLAGWVIGDLPAIGLGAELGFLEEVPSSFIGVMPPILLSADARSGTSIEFYGAIQIAFAAADISSYARVDEALPVRISMRAVESYLPSNMMDGSDGNIVHDVCALQTAILLVSLDSMAVDSSAEIIVVLELSGIDALGISDDAGLGSIIELLAMEQVSVMSHADAARQQSLQYAVNYMTGALATYRDFDFSGFTHHGGSAFAWSRDGLYRLGGDHDSGKVINALVDFGASDYADAHLKRLETAYVGVRTDGECYLRLAEDDGPERVYRLIGGGNQKRSTLAKGVAGRYWNVRLELTDATFATIDNVELEVGVTQRRGNNRRG